MQVESNWANPAGIPGRPWFKHTLYAARFTYGHLELPGLTEAIEKRDWKEAQRQARILAEALGRNAALLRETLAILAMDEASWGRTPPVLRPRAYPTARFS
jgi:N-acetylated-alpha-linked acidic dipeptidase